MVTSLDTSLLNFDQNNLFKNSVCILALFGVIGLLFKKLGDFSKASGHPASGLYYKCLTIIIYECNDSGQYYKTTIIIVIDNPS